MNFISTSIMVPIFYQGFQDNSMDFLVYSTIVKDSDIWTDE
jgi:hypothetical protein